MSLFQEIKRRGVARVGMAYLAGSWLVLQVVETVLPFLGLDEAAGRPVLIALVVGFIPALISAWVFEWTPEGLKLDTDAGIDADAAAVSKRKLDRKPFGIERLLLAESRPAKQLVHSGHSANMGLKGRV